MIPRIFRDRAIPPDEPVARLRDIEHVEFVPQQGLGEVLPWSSQTVSLTSPRQFVTTAYATSGGSTVDSVAEAVRQLPAPSLEGLPGVNLAETTPPTQADVARVVGEAVSRVDVTWQDAAVARLRERFVQTVFARPQSVRQHSALPAYGGRLSAPPFVAGVQFTDYGPFRGYQAVAHSGVTYAEAATFQLANYGRVPRQQGIAYRRTARPRRQAVAHARLRRSSTASSRFVYQAGPPTGLDYEYSSYQAGLETPQIEYGFADGEVGYPEIGHEVISGAFGPLEFGYRQVGGRFERPSVGYRQAGGQFEQLSVGYRQPADGRVEMPDERVARISTISDSRSLEERVRVLELKLEKIEQDVLQVKTNTEAFSVFDVE